jgi:hypothetical protein
MAGRLWVQFGEWLALAGIWLIWLSCNYPTDSRAKWLVWKESEGIFFFSEAQEISVSHDNLLVLDTHGRNKY